MENGWNLFSNGYSGGGGGGGCGSRGGQNDSTCANVAWDIWELGTTSLHQVNASTGVLSGTATTNTDATTTEAACHTRIEASEVHALMFPHNKENTGDASLYAGGRSYYHPDPHLMCLKLGKRHYFEDATPTVDRHAGAAGFKRGKPYLYSGIGGDGGGGGLVVGQSSSEVVTVAVPATVPRCQVEGCHVVLVNAKEYHRRHKVCEMHSKAPKVVVLGLEQRFCQQCSRFHAVSEFDESKRSCRRRLAGHNERRRKSSHLDHPFPTRNPSQAGSRKLKLNTVLNKNKFMAIAIIYSDADGARYKTISKVNSQDAILVCHGATESDEQEPPGKNVWKLVMHVSAGKQNAKRATSPNKMAKPQCMSYEVAR
ncbi:hypothetical protein RJ640_020525 [Escallonia rubra]|uniref:SBP-type domain-containing protein n=1 Tax=Escallonia rubra TaxID=112253 RepID=A0AA88QQW4_9ASTE|nr:hypothetical protein RJ640_020525 [Escallonia rubra]